MDWDKLRIFHAVAEAGSFTHAGDTLNLSQSAISRQISSLEDSIGVTLFHRHARGLLLTEQGEILHKTAKDIFGKLAMIEGQLSDSRQLAEGPLRVTVANFFGASWLSPLITKFKSKYPDIQLTILLDDRIYNLGMREADAAIRLHKPEQQDLIQRQLTKMHFSVCASDEYIERYGEPKTPKDLKKHNLLGFPENALAPYSDPNWLYRVAGVDTDSSNITMINSVSSILKAVSSGAGIATLPNYLIEQNQNIQQLLKDVKTPAIDVYFVYPEERRHSKRIAIFRDFILDEISKTSF